jgi:predicted Zn finger-like uncharacterized protein
MFGRAMDVRCEKCKTEYEFDDARISEAGVTVKCTSCGHVFKVKKRALVVTVPVRPEEAEGALSAGAVTERPREWKVRQASGNVFTFRELTTLQKWIVERKVVRDDEISLTGESWKRLGNIAELASFFQVVDEAQRAQRGPPPPPASPPPTVSGPSSPTGNYGTPQTFGAPPPQGGSYPIHGAGMTFSPPAARLDAMPMEIEDDMKRAGVKGGALKWLLILLVLVALGGGGYYGYFYWWLPEQQRQAQAAAKDAAAAAEAKAKADDVAQAQAKADQDRLKKEQDDAKAKALAAAEAAKADAGAPDAGAAAVAKKEVPHDFDWYMDRGDHLRESDRAEAALDAYAKAAELKPDRCEPVAGKGLALLDMGQHLQAEVVLKQALALNPRYGVAIMGLAETYRSMGKKDDAVQYYQKYLDELPNGSEASVARNAIQKLKQ